MEISKSLKWHQLVCKRLFKETKKDLELGISSNFLTDYVRRYFPIYQPEFKFTLMNAQHIYAKLYGFYNWKELKDYCEGGLNAQT